MTPPPLRAGIIGCGTISGIYLKNGPRFADYDIVACADLNMASAEARAAEYGIEAMSVDALLARPDIDLIINLTIPAAHATVAMQAVQAGKHVYNEKPLTIRLADGSALVAAASAKGVRVGGAPDTFLGSGIQTCRKLIDDGWIGTPVAASAFMLCPGHESWHPNPDFYYQAGGGPMFDMGPYYLTALVTLLGPVARVSGSTRMTYPTRTITSQPKYGQKVTVEVPTHVVGVLDFASGPIATLRSTAHTGACKCPIPTPSAVPSKYAVSVRASGVTFPLVTATATTAAAWGLPTWHTQCAPANHIALRAN